MDNQQPVQPVTSTSEFLNRMDMANNPNPVPEKPKKKLTTPIIIGIIIGVLAIVGGVVAVILMNSSSKPQPTVTTTTEWPEEEEEEELSEEIIERNKIRANDLSPLVPALEQYQANSRDDTVPGEVSQWEWMIRTYIPAGLKDMATGEEYKVKAICKFGEACANIETMTWEENKHEVYVMLNSACKGNTKDNLLVSYTGKRKAAMFSILEGSQSFLCTNN